MIRRTYIFLCFILLSTVNNSQEKDIEVFPKKTLFPSLLMDTKESRTYLSIARPVSESILKYNTYVPFALGFKKGIIRRNKTQLTFDIGAHTQFGWRKENNEFKQGVRRSDLNTDYILGFCIERKFTDRFYGRLRVFHQSTHLGDDYVLYYSIPRTGYWASDLSNYEQVEFTVLYGYRYFLAYTGIGRIITSLTERKRMSYQLGAYTNGLPFTGLKNFIVGLDVKLLQQNNYVPMLKFGTGLKVNSGNPIYLMLEYYSGNLPYSRFDSEVSTKWIGLSIYFESYL